MLEAIVQYLSSASGIPDDQVRYMLLMITSFPLGLLFRHVLHPSHTSLTTRHLFSSLTGLTLTTLCFGWYTLLPIVTVGVSYIFLLTLPPHSVQRYTMVWVILCISAAHIHRTITDPGGWTLDVSGPLMILVQKMSLVAFAVHDGMGGNRKPLNGDQRKHKLDSVPSVLEYMSYCFNFHSVLAGPAVTMREHLSFMDGSNFTTGSPTVEKEPSAFYPVISKLLLALTCVAVYLLISNPTPIPIDPSMSVLQRLVYFYVCIISYRCRYYFIFVLNDSINNAAGLGFEGYDSLNRAKWGLATNVNIKDLELSMNMRQSINSWNTTSAKWLRRVCYERVSWQPTLMSFVLSAVWHGFYPGYYFCFISLSISLESARKMRKLCNPFFTSRGPVLKWCYHLATWATTQVWVAFCALTVSFPWASDVILYWSYYYFIPIVVSLLIIFLVPSGKTNRHKTKEEEEVVEGEGEVGSGASHTAGATVSSKKLD